MNAVFTIKSAIIALAMGAAAGCSAAIEDQGTGADGAGTPAPSGADAALESPKDCDNIRNDHVSNITVSNGNYGTWGGCYDMCPAGSFAYQLNLRSEAPRQSGDDTSVNAISLSCFDRNTHAFTEFVESKQQVWGTWLAQTNCNGTSDGVTDFSNPIVSGNLRLEAPQGGSDDDTSANGLKFSCKNAPNTEVTAFSNTGWGSFRGKVQCPAGTAVCGIQTRVEDAQGSEDDTALNGLKFACCTF